MIKFTKVKPEDALESRLDCPSRRRPVAKGTVKLRLLPDGISKSGIISNLSAQGCSLLVGYAPEAEVDTRAELTLCMRGEIVILASVIQRKRGKVREGGELGTELGLEFTDVSARKAEQIAGLIPELS